MGAQLLEAKISNEDLTNSCSSRNGMLGRKQTGGQDLANPDSGTVSMTVGQKFLICLYKEDSYYLPQRVILG